MKRNAKRLAWICIVALLCGMPAAWVGNAMDPTLVITSRSGGSTQLAYLSYSAGMHGKWQWLQVPDNMPLSSLSLEYEPTEDVAYIQVQIPGQSGVTILENGQTLNFTNSDSSPYYFAVIAPGSSSPFWAGWLTVSHSARPSNLPSTPGSSVPNPGGPTLGPTLEPRPTPTQAPMPTWAPTAMPWPTQRPTAQPTRQPTTQTGYGIITANNVNLRRSPNGSVVGQLQYGNVVYINGQEYDPTGVTWHYVTVMGTNQTGYVHGSFVRFMTAQEVNDYLNRPTARPTPTAPPGASSGYARTVWQSSALRSGPYDTASVLRQLNYGSVVYVTQRVTDSNGYAWLAANASGVSGYVLASSVVMMTAQEVADYLNSIRPTVAPTLSPTMAPNTSYGVVRMDNVNFRQSPNGAPMRRLHTGYVVRLLGNPVYQDGFGWYPVEYDGVAGYLRSDMLDIVRTSLTPQPR